VIKNNFKVVACPNPFTNKRIEMEVLEGGNIVDMMNACNIPEQMRELCVVSVGSEIVPKKQWEKVRPRANSFVAVRAVPEGGGGGDSNKALRTVAMVAIIMVSAYVGGEAGLWASNTAKWGKTAVTLAKSGASATTYFMGSLAVNALLPPPMMSLGSGGIGSTGSPAMSLSGTRNELRPFQPVPRIYGKYRVFPPLASAPYTEISGGDQYLNLLFAVGHGIYNITDMKIGDTAVGSFSDVTTEIKDGTSGQTAPSIYKSASRITEIALSETLVKDTGVIRTTSVDTEEFSVDFLFPYGLHKVNWHDTPNVTEKNSVTVKIETSAMGAGSWSTQFNGDIESNSKDGFWYSKKITIAKGQYDVRVTVTSDIHDPNAKNSEFYYRDVIQWRILRSVNKTSVPVKLDGTCLVAMRIKASDQLSGVVDTFNCLAESKITGYKTGSWAVEATSNPASIFRDILQGVATQNTVADSRIDLTALQTWHANCVTASREFNGVFDFRTTLFEAL
jgi:sulfur carrier protein ThiS